MCDPFGRIESAPTTGSLFDSRVPCLHPMYTHIHAFQPIRHPSPLRVLKSCEICSISRAFVDFSRTILFIALFFFFFFLAHFYLPASGYAVVTGPRCRPFFPPVLLPSIFIAHRVQQTHCSSIFHRVLLTHALALSASQFVHKKKSPRIHTSMHSGGARTHETDLYQARG